MLNTETSADSAHAAETVQAVRFINDETGQEIIIDIDDMELDQVIAGNILTRKDETGKHHFQIVSADGFPEEPARLVPAKSNLKNVLVLLGTLTAIWFVIDWLKTFLL